VGNLSLYAQHGKIEVYNNVGAREISGFRVEMKNNANIVYDSGLNSTLFSAGANAGYNINGWREG